VIDPTDEGATMVVAPGRMIDNSLPIPDAEFLPLYRMALKLACVNQEKTSKIWGVVLQRSSV
jgi:hypothetical protein